MLEIFELLDFFIFGLLVVAILVVLGLVSGFCSRANVTFLGCGGVLGQLVVSVSDEEVSVAVPVL
jgi:uncharacterized membrane protein (DUF4010 family)